MNGMMDKLEEMNLEKLEEPTRRVEDHERRNWTHFVNKNIVSVVRFYSGPVKLTIGWLNHVDMMIRQHVTSQGMLMKRGMATSRLYMKPDDMGMGSEAALPSTSWSWSDSSSSTSGEPSFGVSCSGGWRSSPSETARGCGSERLKMS